MSKRKVEAGSVDFDIVTVVWLWSLIWRLSAKRTACS
jgi:hypothetical protein